MGKRSHTSEEESEDTETETETEKSTENEEEEEEEEEERGKRIVIRVVVSGGERRQKMGFSRSSSSSSSNYCCCQADECGMELSSAKTYHRRHKVCERHAKAPVVLVKGMRQRFCQQCSRFHEISEFDDTKRSCRNLLAGHNERRRKSQANPMGEDRQKQQLT